MNSLSHFNKHIFFIPARGGSKGILNKNLQLIGDKSLIANAICIGREVNSMLNVDTEIIVSSNSDDILKEAENNGAVTHVRPNNISGDDGTTEQALEHFLLQESGSNELSRTLVSLVQCTSPFSKPIRFLEGLDMVANHNFDSSFLGIANHYWLYKKEANDVGYKPIGHDLKFRPSRQKIVEQIHETGAAYIFSAENFLQNKFRTFGKIHAVKCEYLESVDIDTPEDLETARKILTL